MSKKTSKTGPAPARLKIEGDWESAVQTALGKKRPPEGWPQGVKPKKRAKKKG